MNGLVSTINSTKKIVNNSNVLYENFLGYAPNQTNLKIISKEDWENFCKKYNLNKNSQGIYLTRNQSAIMLRDSPFFILNLFHEYFGHGLFCEESLSGKNLINLEKKLFSQEMALFEEKEFNPEVIYSFREQNPLTQQIRALTQSQQELYEQFAVFSEFFLSKNFNLISLFNQKYLSNINKGYHPVIENLINFNQRWGDLATFYSFGLSKIHSKQRINQLLQEVFPQDLKKIKFALVYGSKKEFSDLDLFFVSEDIKMPPFNWLDIRNNTPTSFEKKLSLFDIDVADPLCSGEFVFGDEDYYLRSKAKLFSQPITKEAIDYNFLRSEEQKKAAQRFPESSLERLHGIDYAITYLANSFSLNQKRRIFTKKELLSCAFTEIPIELKGGSKNEI